MTFFRSAAAASMLLSAAGAASLSAQSTLTTTATPAHKAPTACLQELLDYRKDLIKSAQSSGKPIDRGAITKQLSAKAKSCAELADTASLDRANLVDYGQLQLIAGDTSAAILAFDKAAEGTGTADNRVPALVAIISIMASSPHANEFLDKLDQLPDIRARFKAREALMGYYSNYDIDDKLEATAHQMIALSAKLSPEDQQKASKAIMFAYRSLASTYGNRLHPDSSIAILRAATQQQPNIAGIAAQLQPDIARYEMIGKAAPSLAADQWINSPVTNLGDTVSILMFTANWCHSCRDSYPTVKKLGDEIGGKGLRTVLAVQLDGMFEGVTMTAEQETAANRTYFADKLSSKLPIAIQLPTPEGEQPKPENNLVAFRVGALPTFIVVDKKGTVRAILTGWDPYGNRARALSAVVGTLANAS